MSLGSFGDHPHQISSVLKCKVCILNHNICIFCIIVYIYWWNQQDIHFEIIAFYFFLKVNFHFYFPPLKKTPPYQFHLVKFSVIFTWKACGHMWLSYSTFMHSCAFVSIFHSSKASIPLWLVMTLHSKPDAAFDYEASHVVVSLEAYSLFVIPRVKFLFVIHMFSVSFTPGVPFPKNFQQVCKKMLSRLFRVFVHVYIHHFDSICSMGAEAHINTCYKHYYYFISEFNLIDHSELEPLVRACCDAGRCKRCSRTFCIPDDCPCQCRCDTECQHRSKKIQWKRQLVIIHSNYNNSFM